MSYYLVYLSGMIHGTVFCLVLEYRHDQSIFCYGSTFKKGIEMPRIVYFEKVWSYPCIRFFSFLVYIMVHHMCVKFRILQEFGSGDKGSNGVSKGVF